MNELLCFDLHCSPSRCSAKQLKSEQKAPIIKGNAPAHMTTRDCGNRQKNLPKRCWTFLNAGGLAPGAESVEVITINIDAVIRPVRSAAEIQGLQRSPRTTPSNSPWKSLSFMFPHRGPDARVNDPHPRNCIPTDRLRLISAWIRERRLDKIGGCDLYSHVRNASAERSDPRQGPH